MPTINFNEAKYKEVCQEFGETLAIYEKEMISRINQPEGAFHEELYELYKWFAEGLDTLITDALYAER